MPTYSLSVHKYQLQVDAYIYTIGMNEEMNE